MIATAATPASASSASGDAVIRRTRRARACMAIGARGAGPAVGEASLGDPSSAGPRSEPRAAARILGRSARIDCIILPVDQLKQARRR